MSTNSTASKIRALQTSNEDFEWYPTTAEIMDAMKKDIWNYLRIHENDYESGWRGGKTELKIDEEWENKNKKERLHIDTFLDIGAGDGRVLNFFEARKKYGIEIARVQADDLIPKGIFLIGRNYWDVSLIEQQFSLIYSNPPYSIFEKWVNKLLTECNFRLLYLVMPIRWKNQKEITKELERYEVTVVGEFDFSEADREARGRVNLVRVNAPWVTEKHTGERVKYQQTLEGAFERWVKDQIADFKDKPDRGWEEEREESVALKKTPIDQLVDDYDTEKGNLGAAFKSIGKLPPEIIKIMGQDKKSMLEIIRQSITGLKSKYWR
ncbi:MAG: class I SAM-dependent methyltransferase, partial [Spirochaetaceae bacterium]|nr:class I SAM-dependent methyltransferase [Spirochaetaceae bacterium]